MWNLVLSCPTCNQNKGDSDPTPEQLVIVKYRRELNILLINVGKYVGYKKKLGEFEEMPKLIKTIEVLCEMIVARKTEADLPYSMDELTTKINSIPLDWWNIQFEMK
jgi:hypothetical protein